MKINKRWRKCAYDHGVWDLIRYYRALNARSRNTATEWLDYLGKTNQVVVGEGRSFSVPENWVSHIVDYVAGCTCDLVEAIGLLRIESAAVAYCDDLGVPVRATKTRSKDHHQAPQALVATVTELACRVCRETGVSIVPNPKYRAVWCAEHDIHVSARNLDGAIPSLADPIIIWEIKEYWGKTKGGSKMSDAVYECHLVGRELRDYERRSGTRVSHVVFLDGHDQWTYRKSDLVRFIDLFHQGLIDKLIIGREVEEQWVPYLREQIRGI